MTANDQRGVWQRFLEWLFPPKEQPQLTNRDQNSRSDQSDGENRYDVKDANGNSVAGSDSLAEAHREWQNLTDQGGQIIDTETGNDVTPPPDDNGRFVVLDKSDEQLDSFSSAEAALDSWRKDTNESGSVIDTKTGEDLTAKLKGFLTQEELNSVLKQVFGTRAGKGRASRFMLGINPDTVAHLAEQINHLPVPVFSVTNISGKQSEAPKKTVEITRRKVEIVTKERIVEVDAPGPPSPSVWTPVPYPTEEWSQERIRRPSDITRVRPSDLAQPEPILHERIARRTLRRPNYEEEIPGKPTVVKKRVVQQYEEPEVTEWTEEVEVSEEPQAQLLELIVDISGSMGMEKRMNLAIAVAVVLIGKHVDDGSRYFYRQFASSVGKLYQAFSADEKREFVRFLVAQKESDLGGGTRILLAVDNAARDVRQKARHGDRAEVLIITDGDDSVSAQDIYDATGDDVTLHTVIVGYQGNASLRQHSSTYYHLWVDRELNVSGTNEMHVGVPVIFDEDFDLF